jgi:hypothetical protein
MRRAVVIGSNGPSDLSPLRYAARDAEGVGQALSGPRCGFQIVTAPAASDAFAVKRLIIDAVETCEPQDTFLLYFSGHGVLDKGSIFLLWDNTSLERLLGSALPVAEIMNALSYCWAENKLFVLNCCHARGISGYGFKDASAVPVEETVKPENFLVLMASKRLERACGIWVVRPSCTSAEIRQTTARGIRIAIGTRSGLERAGAVDSL